MVECIIIECARKTLRISAKLAHDSEYNALLRNSIRKLQ